MQLIWYKNSCKKYQMLYNRGHTPFPPKVTYRNLTTFFIDTVKYNEA